MGANSRDKGNGFELEVAKAFTKRFDVAFKRTPLSGGWSNKREVQGDIVCIDRNDFPYCIECKNAEGWQLESLLSHDNYKWFTNWWAQATSESPDGKIPILVFKKNHIKPLAAMWACHCDEHLTFYPSEFIQKHIGINVIIARFDAILEQLKWDK
jgi:hypothetical protein